MSFLYITTNDAYSATCVIFSYWSQYDVSELSLSGPMMSTFKKDDKRFSAIIVSTVLPRRTL